MHLRLIGGDRNTTVELGRSLRVTPSSALLGDLTEPDFGLFDVTLLRLRALLARARGDETSYRDFAERYTTMATSLGFQGHMAPAEVL